MAKKKTSKKISKKAVKKVAKKAAKKTAKKVAKKVAKKAAKKAGKKAKAAVEPASVEQAPLERVAHAAYLNYLGRIEKGLPGDERSDWLAAEEALRAA